MREFRKNVPTEDIVTERIFNNSSAGIRGPIEGLSDYENRIQMAIKDADSYEHDYLSEVREKLMAFYDGTEPALSEEEGRSTFVSTDVRDVIMSILPSIIRIFASSQNVVEFVANSEQGDAEAKQATDYVNYVFWRDNQGFLIAHAVFKDALTLRTGIVKWWTDINHEVTENTYNNISQEQYQYLISERPDVEVVGFETNPNGTANVTLRYVVSKPLTKVAAVPPEEFRISRDAKDIKSARLVGHKRQVQISELVKMGLPEDVLEDMTSSLNWYSDEKFMRNPGLVDTGYYDDGVTYGEFYIRVDKDGDGIDELRFIQTIGDDNIVFSDVIADTAKFAMFCPDPTPHTAVGESASEQVADIQKIKSNMIRAVLDNLAEVVRPRTAVNETLVNLEDALNPEQSAIVRVRGNPNDVIMPMKSTFVGTEVYTMIEQIDRVRASRTGITEASRGLDPRAMQSVALTGVDAIIAGAQERIELIARIFAETGWTDLMLGLLKEITNNPNPERSLRIRGKWQNYNPSTFDPGMGVEVNPNLGKGADMTRLMALREIKATQEMIIGKWGPKNPVVGPQEYRNTMVDILEIVNIKDVSRYFRPIDEKVMAQIMNTPDEPDPAAVLAKAEFEKVKASTIKTIADTQLDEKKLQMDDDFRRDKLATDTAVKVLDIQVTAKSNEEPKEELKELNTPNG